MKQLCALLALLLALVSVAGCASQQARPDQQTPASETQTPPPESDIPVQGDAPVSQAEILEDFTVQTIDGSSFTLSEALQSHKLVLINLFATWCGPCGMEFPYLQEAWSQCADEVAVIALSIEPTDTDEVLRQYAEEKGLSFPMGSTEGTELARFVTEGIPTTILVDRAGQIAGVEVGAKTSTQSFLSLFSGFTAADYDPDLCRYTVCAYDRNYEPVEGVVVNFCTDVSCSPITTGADGIAVFTGTPARYHVQVIQAPEGLQLSGADSFDTEPYGQTFWLPFMEAQP